MTLNMRKTAMTWLVQRSPARMAPHVGNFPVKQTVTSEKLHTNKVWEHGRG